ncbi:MAG TPA: hypothetical protein VI248_11355 [Kineosporiaceae bacterium]
MVPKISPDVSAWDIARKVLIFLGIPLAAGYPTRTHGERAKGRDWYESRFLRPRPLHRGPGTATSAPGPSSGQGAGRELLRLRRHGSAVPAARGARVAGSAAGRVAAGWAGAAPVQPQDAETGA